MFLSKYKKPILRVKIDGNGGPDNWVAEIEYPGYEWGCFRQKHIRGDFDLMWGQAWNFLREYPHGA